jgi:hypothetical protein
MICYCCLFFNKINLNKEIIFIKKMNTNVIHVLFDNMIVEIKRLTEL